MLFMVIERSKNRDARAVYRRAREHGRMLPEGTVELLRPYRRLFILAHETTIALDVGTQNCCELAFHDTPPRSRLSLYALLPVNRQETQRAWCQHRLSNNAFASLRSAVSKPSVNQL